MGRPEADGIRTSAMTVLGTGLSEAEHHEDALAVKEADLSLQLRLGVSEESILATQGNLAATYAKIGRLEEAAQMERDVYSGYLKLHGEEHEYTLRAAGNCVSTLVGLLRFEEVKCCKK